MTAIADELCSQCGLPVGRYATWREITGDRHAFCCYGCCLAYQVRNGQADESEAAWLLIRLGVGAFLAMNVMLLSLFLYARGLDSTETGLRQAVHLLLWALATPVMGILGWMLLRSALHDLADRRLGAELLICLGSGAAYAYSVLSILAGGEHVYFDIAATLLVLFTLGRFLEALGRARAMRSLAPMLAAERAEATLLADGREVQRPASEIRAGDLVLVRPGERIAVDGVVVDGRSTADEMVLTGEGKPAEKCPGSMVFAGSVNHEGVLVVRTAAAGMQSRWAQICRIVRDALRQETRSYRLADRIAAVFIPAVLVTAVLTIVHHSSDGTFENALLNGLAVLVIACPCALGLATPMALSLGIGRLARRGCLVRGGTILEALASVRGVAFDKTGTLTCSRLHVVAVETFDVRADAVLRYAAALERHSGHPFERSIVDAALARTIEVDPADGVRLVPGCGVVGSVGGTPAAAGRLDWLSDLGCSMPADLPKRARVLDATGLTVIYVAWAGCVRGAILIDAPLLAEATATVDALRRLGVRTMLLTGDLPAAGQRVADAVGIDAWQARLSPEAKQDALAAWEARIGSVAMVGDGINDAPVLATASVGIAVGTATDLARESAGLVLPEGGLRHLPWAIRLSRAVRTTIATNLVWAFSYNAIGIALAVQGLLQPVIAAGLMAVSSVVVILNSLRLESAVKD
ncbi:MAG TPA: heavy metal translocating P-type ATPase [Azospirillum sp.]|nr:heavy metal translocating P-type ATPase [Azospirillum sp.]